MPEIKTQTPMRRACKFVGEGKCGRGIKRHVGPETIQRGTLEVAETQILQSFPISFLIYLVVKILCTLENATTHLHNRRDRHQERDDPHNGANLRKKKEGNG